MSFATDLLTWFDSHGRHDLPWQQSRTLYRVWVSEVMLQQTQVQSVFPFFERFIARFPDLPRLADAPLDTVLALWSGLGYYSRARNLHRAAILCRTRGDLPPDFDALLALPGIGRSTAGAILAQALGQRFPILDGNVRRVLARLHCIEGDTRSPQNEARLWALSEALLPNNRLADYTQAIMDLGATICTRGAPKCVECPVQEHCSAYASGMVAQYPMPRTRRERPLRSRAFLWLHDDQQRLALIQRPAQGIWGGLFAFPDGETIAEICAANGLDAPKRCADTMVRHEFTHFSLDMHVWRVADASTAVAEGGLRWFARDEALALGLPQPIRRLIEQEG